MQFESIIEDCLKNELSLTSSFSISPNKKRGQSITYTIYDSTGKAIWMVKFFDYLTEIESFLKPDRMKSYDNLNELLDDIENAGNFPYNIEDIIDSIELQKRCFNRYIKVGEIQGLRCFPKIIHYKNEIKIGKSFLGLLVEEYVLGETLEQKLKGIIIDKKDFIFDFLYQLADRLNELSMHGIIHRDISPDNIMIADGTYILIDPGVVKIDDGDATKSKMMLGKCMYASPEQYFGNARSATFKSDLYAVGIIALEILLGYNPLTKIITDGERVAPHTVLLNRYNRDIEDSIFKVIDEDEFTSRLLLIIKKLIQIEEHNRFDSIDSFQAALNTMKGLVKNNE